MNKHTIPFIALAMAFTLATAAPAVFARDNGENEDSNSMMGNSSIMPMNGMMDNLNRAFGQLEKFKMKDFEASDFSRATIPSSLTINPQGDIRITNGTATGLTASSTLSVKIWGITFTVNTDANTQISSGSSQQGTVGGINTGDKVDILGTTSDATPGVIQAKVIHDRSATNQARDEQISRLRQLINELVQKLQGLLGTSTTTP